MSQPHNTQYTEKPMTTYGRTQGPSRRYRRLRHPTFLSTEWTAKNPLLQRGEIGAESDTYKAKIGDGVTYWNDLPYIQAEGQPLSDADYQMGNSSGGWTTMSQAQQDALNSGATSAKINSIDGKLNLDGTNTMTGVLKMRASISFQCAIAPCWDGVGFYKLNDNDSVTLMASMESTTGFSPFSTNTYDIGTSSKKWKNLYLAGKVFVGTINNGADITIPATSGTMALTSDIITYTGSDGITLTGTNFTNSGVRSVASGTANGTISVNTNGTSADVSVTGLGSAAYTASSDYATAAQGTLASTAVQPGNLATVATTGNYDDLLNKPTIPAAQVNSDWNANSGVAEILNKPTTLAGYGITDGANTDLSNLTATGEAKFTAKANVALDNLTSAGKQVCANMAMPSGTSTTITLGASGASYTAPANGYFNFRGMGTAAGQYAYIGDAYYSGVAYQRSIVTNGDWIVTTIPVKKGQSIIINYSTGANNALYFIKAEGDM